MGLFFTNQTKLTLFGHNTQLLKTRLLTLRMTDPTPNANFTEDKETRKVVTPFAFGVHESLLGMRLASPMRRLMALLIDFICIALLTLLDSYWLTLIVFLIAVKTFIRIRKDEGKQLIKFSLGGISVFALLLLFLQTWLSGYINSNEAEIDADKAGVEVQQLMQKQPALTFDGRGYELEISSLLDDDKKAICKEESACDTRFFEALSSDLISKGIKFKKANKIYEDVRAFLEKHDRLDSDSSNVSLGQSVYESRFSKAHSITGNSSGAGSFMEWVEGRLGDLGWSFGWASVYFSVLTAWWQGQTVGKRVLGIKVVRIDGGDIDLWESIGRYGGYSAGLATGLSGFLQIYWDANRQAIQDKISETLVIRP